VLFIGRAGSTPVLGTETLDNCLVVRGFVFLCRTVVELLIPEATIFYASSSAIYSLVGILSGYF
jgi:hypothetical protein